MTRVRKTLCSPASVVLLTTLLTTVPAWAQLSTAELNGRVTDSSGAVLPGVTVTATQTATGLERTAVTDGEGVYLLTNLPPGPYRLEVSLQGFRSYVQTGLVLTVGATPTVNAALELGSLEETVTVEAAAPLVDVRSAGISSVVENERIVELPLQGRQVTDLLVLAGAAVQTATATSRSAPGGVRISVGGGFETGVAYVLDGATTTTRRRTSTAAAVSGRAPGVPRRDERADRAERRQVGGGGQRRDQVGHQPVLGERLRVHAALSVQRDQPVCGDRPGRPADRRRAQAQPVRRHAGWADRAGQAVLLRRLPGHRDPPAAGVEHRLRTHGPDADGRPHHLRLGPVQRRPPDDAASAVREQPARSGSPESGRADGSPPGCPSRPIRAARSPTRSGTTATSIRRSGASTSSSRPITPSSGGTSCRIHQATGLRRRRRQHPEVVRPGHRRDVARG